MSEHITFTEAQLRHMCRRWQKRLRLQDWHADVRVLRLSEMDEESGCGQSFVREQCKDSSIGIVDPRDYKSDASFPYDMEVTLVHELIHLHLMPFEPASRRETEHAAFEAAIDCLAEALVLLGREG